MTTLRLLLIETSQQPGFVAVAEGDRLLSTRHLDEARRHARDLAPAAGELLKTAGWKPGDISAVVVSLGPGSYTGLRVGVMSAKAFAYATGCALIGMETFAVLAAQVPVNTGHVAVIADAQQDKVYVQEFEKGVAMTPLSIQLMPQWQASATAMCVTGPGLRKWSAQLPAHLKPVSQSLWDPKPETLLQTALARYVRGERDDFWKAEPIYLRPSAAEEKWASRAST